MSGLECRCPAEFPPIPLPVALAEMVLLLGDTRVSGFAIGQSVTANLDHMCLDDQSHYSLDLIEFRSELCVSQSLLADTIEMNEK